MKNYIHSIEDANSALLADYKEDNIQSHYATQRLIGLSTSYGEGRRDIRIGDDLVLKLKFKRRDVNYIKWGEPTMTLHHIEIVSVSEDVTDDMSLDDIKALVEKKRKAVNLEYQQRRDAKYEDFKAKLETLGLSNDQFVDLLRDFNGLLSEHQSEIRWGKRI